MPTWPGCPAGSCSAEAPAAPPDAFSPTRCRVTHMGRSYPNWPSSGSPATTSCPWPGWLTSTTAPTAATSASPSVCSAAPAPCRLRDVPRSARYVPPLGQQPLGEARGGGTGAWGAHTRPGVPRASEIPLLELSWGCPSFRAPHSPGISTGPSPGNGLLGTLANHPGPLGLCLLITEMRTICL